MKSEQMKMKRAYLHRNNWKICQGMHVGNGGEKYRKEAVRNKILSRSKILGIEH